MKFLNIYNSLFNQPVCNKNMLKQVDEALHVTWAKVMSRYKDT